MSRRKIIGISVIIVILIIVVAGFSKMVMPMFAKNQALASSAGSQMDSMAINASRASGYENQSVAKSSDYDAASEQAVTNITQPADKGKTKSNSSIKKIIKDANVSVEVKNIDQDFKKIATWVESNGGYEFNRQASSYASSKNVTVVFKVPPEKLNVFLSFLSTVGNLSTTNISSNDITDDYYDTAARLQNLKNGRDQFLEIMKKAGTIDELLKVQAELNNITGEIESLEGKLKMWDKLVAESTVSLSISEQSKPVNVSQNVSWNFSTPGEVWQAMKNGFIMVTNSICSILLWLLIAVVTLSPIIVIVVIIILIIKIMRKKKKQE